MESAFSQSGEAPLLKRTLLMVSAMLGACVVFVGTLCLVALLIVGKAVGPTTTNASNESGAAPAGDVGGGATPAGLPGQPAKGDKSPATASNRKVM